MDGVREALNAITVARKILYHESRKHIDRFWDHHITGNKDRAFDESSILGVRAQKGRNGDFYAYWYWNKWVKDKRGKTRTLSTGIQKGRKDNRYPTRALKKRAQEWEVDVVLEVEDALSVIRQKLRKLKLAELALRELEKILVAEARADSASESADATA